MSRPWARPGNMSYRSPLECYNDEPGPIRSYSQPHRYSPYARPPLLPFPHPPNGHRHLESYERNSHRGHLAAGPAHGLAPFDPHSQRLGSDPYLDNNHASSSQFRYDVATCSSSSYGMVPLNPHLGHRGEVDLYENHPSSSQPKYSDRYKPNNYPPELTKLFEPLDCRLCGVEATTPIVAKMHYGGKQHKKKVKQFMIEWTQKTGEPMPDLEPPSVPTTAKHSALPDYCKVCDVRLISDSDKLQHFSGKTHQKNLLDPTRKKKKISQELDDPTNRFGIGISFTTPGTAATPTDSEKEVSPDDFACHLCNVRAVSIEQLQMHLQGKKHKHMEEKNAAEPDPSKRFRCSLCQVALTTRDLFEKHIKGKKHQKNMARQEMEGVGKDFCEICNLSFTSFEHYDIHIKGKKHEKKCKEVLRKPVEMKADNCSLVCESCPFVGNIDEHDCDMSLANLTPEDLEGKIVCKECHNFPFDTEEEYRDHFNSRRHILCTLNSNSGDEVIQELIHYYCRVCRVQYKNNITYARHLMEETHMKNSSRQPTDLETTTDLFHCSVCKIMIDAEGYNEHMRNRKHLKQALINDTLNTIKKLSHENITTSSFQCKNCNLIVYSFVEYTGHVLSEEHLDTMITAKLNGYI